MNKTVLVNVIIVITLLVIPTLLLVCLNVSLNHTKPITKDAVACIVYKSGSPMLTATFIDDTVVINSNGVVQGKTMSYKPGDSELCIVREINDNGAANEG